MPARIIIPFHDLRTSLRKIEPEVEAAIRRVLSSGRFILGPELEKFESEFARYTGAPYCAGVGSGTDAITLSLKALGIGKGDEVITSALTAYPTITGIAGAGARPVLVDVRQEDGLIDPALVEKLITSRTKAIVPVHLYGQCCDMQALIRLARRHSLKIVEDCAQSAGATCGNRHSGTYGDCGAFSFYPTKNLGALGDGGAVITKNAAVYRKVLSLRDYGRVGSRFVEEGVNSRLDEIQAAVLRVKLKRLERWIQERRSLAKTYEDHLSPDFYFADHQDRRHVYHLFPVRVPRRRAVIKELKSKGISIGVHYARPVFEEKAFRWPVRGPFTHATRICREVLSLPLFPGMTRRQVLYVIRCLNEALRR